MAQKRSLTLHRKKDLFDFTVSGFDMHGFWVNGKVLSGRLLWGQQIWKVCKQWLIIMCRAKRKEGRSPVHAAHRKNTVAWIETQSGLCFSLANQRFMLHEKPPIGRPCSVIHRRGFPTHFFLSLSFSAERDFFCSVCYVMHVGWAIHFILHLSLVSLHVVCLKHVAPDVFT